ncbi:MAG: FGGY-family carbohydrate kinase, partial [Bacteroidales bacterium]
AGNVLTGITTLTIGASMAMCVTMDQPVNDLSFRVSCQCHSVPGKYFLLPYVQTAGLLLKWYKDNFCQSEVELSERTNIDVFDLLTEMASKIPPGAEGLTILPHFMGAGSPYFNQKVKGVFAGITIGMGKGHFVRAIMEAVSAEVKHNLETLSKKDIIIREIRLLGGGSKSPLWCQILSDMTGLNVSTMTSSENAALGAAILAGVGTGVFRSIDHGCNLCIELKKVYQPEPEGYKFYRDIYERYLKLYDSLEGYW